MRTLTKEEVYSALRETFPKQNDFSETDYSEELRELFDFGIYTRAKLQSLINKHLKTVLEIDSSEMDEFHIKAYSDELGKEYVEDRVKNRYWFAYPGLLRIVMELEFGDKYIKYANKRDEIN